MYRGNEGTDRTWDFEKDGRYRGVEGIHRTQTLRKTVGTHSGPEGTYKTWDFEKDMVSRPIVVHSLSFVTDSVLIKSSRFEEEVGHSCLMSSQPILLAIRPNRKL